MSEYIERVCLIDWLNNVDGIIADGTVEAPTLYKQILTDINNFPAADVAEVVRCKDCRWYLEDVGWCYEMSTDMCENDYCSYGERKDGAE